jgi:ABC-type transport system substrate-binding protein
VHVDAVELHVVDDADAALAALGAGEVDWAPVPAGVASPPGDAVLVAEPFQAEIFLGLNSAVPPLDDPALRQAIAAAIDREVLVEEALDDAGVPLAVVVPAGVDGHDPDACGDRCAADPDAARRILAEGYPDGEVPTVPFDFDDSDRQQRLAEAVARQLDEVGIDVELRPQPLRDYSVFVASGEQRMFSSGWIGLHPSPAAYLRPLFSSDSADNLVGLADRRIDRALADGDWPAVERRVLELAVVVPVAQYQSSVAVAPRVRELRHRTDGGLDLASVWLDDGG